MRHDVKEEFKTSAVEMQVSLLLSEILVIAGGKRRERDSSANLVTSGQGPQGVDEQEAVLLEISLEGACYQIVRVKREEDTDVNLSPRETEIVRLVAKGHVNKAIAKILDISPWTVNTHMRRIFTKLGVNSRAEMVARASKLNVVNFS